MAMEYFICFVERFSNGDGVNEMDGDYSRNGTLIIMCTARESVLLEPCEEDRRIVPLTVKVVDRLTEPARFDAEQAYSPAWRAETPSMMRVLKCLLILVIVIPVSFDVSIGTPLNAHVMSIGISPFRIEQGTDTESPQLATSALKVMGRSCGATKSVIEQTIMLHSQMLSVKSTFALVDTYISQLFVRIKFIHLRRTGEGFSKHRRK